MPLITITKTYLNGNNPTQVDLDNALDSISTFLNTILLDNTNIQTGGLVGTKFSAATLNSSQFATGAITSSAIASSAVGQTKRAALNFVTSTGQLTGTFTLTNGPGPIFLPTPIGGLSVSITSIGRPIFLGIMSSSTGFTTKSPPINTPLPAEILLTTGVNTTTTLNQLLYRRSTTASGPGKGICVSGTTVDYYNNPNQTLQVSLPFPSWIDVPGPGTFIYDVLGMVKPLGSTTSTATYSSCQLFAYEL